MTETVSNPDFDSINTLFGLLAKAFELETEDLARHLENGDITLDPGQDDDETRFVIATFKQNGNIRTARLYRDALFREVASTGPAKPAGDNG